MFKNKFVIVLSVITFVLLIWQVVVMIDITNSVHHVLPDQINPWMLTWKQSSDQYLSVPNFFLLPLIVLGIYIFAKRADAAEKQQ